GENVVHLGESGCPPLLGLEKATVGFSDNCSEPTSSVINYVAGNDELTRVMLSFRGAADVSGTGFGDPVAGTFRIKGTNLPADESIQRALQQTVDYLVQKRKTVWLILQVPELGFTVAECVGRPFSFEQRLRTPCAVPKDAVVIRQAKYRRIVDEVKQRQPALKTFDPLPFLCDETWCYA